MRGYFTILRPLNCLMAGFAVVIGAKIAGPIFLSQAIGLAALAAVLICGAGNVINDYFDVEIDRVNNPSRPLPSGAISLKAAHRYSLLLFASGVGLAIFINPPALLIAAFNSGVLYLYASTVKGAGGLTKNLTVSYLVASPFLFGGIAVGNPIVTLFLVLVAFLVNTAREVVKDIEDYEGDLGHLESLPVKFGFRTAGLLASVFIAASILFSTVPYTTGMMSRIYLLFIIPANIMLSYSVVVLIRSPKEKSGGVQRLIKAAMVLALMGFFLGSF